MIKKNIEISTNQVVGLVVIAYAFSFMVRMIWIWQFQDNPNFIWNNELMINTNDGYFFASGAQHVLGGVHEANYRIPKMWDYGTIAITVFLTKVTFLPLETVILYMPALISSILVIPIILISRLYNQVLWGFLAALLGSITWSYYNRTMIGYYDTDMFSAMAPMFILYFLMKSTIDFNLKSALYAAITISFYSLLYDQGRSIVYGMGILYTGYLIVYHRSEKVAYLSIILVFLSLIPFGFSRPYENIIHIIFILLMYFTLVKVSFSKNSLIIISAILFFVFLVFGNVFSIIWEKISMYIATGVEQEGLHFYSVTQTVREAGKISFETFANRISGSTIGALLALIGYIIMVIRHRAFLLALPLVGIGVFALFGGLRFTVYAVPVAAMSAIYLFFVLADFFKDQKIKYAFIVFSTVMMMYPNIIHIIGYKVPTVLNKFEVTDLNKLKKISTSDDYTLSWWDYGYPIMFYTNTSTLIDGGKHANDNFIISKIMQSSSSEFVANFSRLSVETYAEGTKSYTNYKENGFEKADIPNKFKMIDNEGQVYHSGSGSVINSLLKNKQKNLIDPHVFLSELESNTFELPTKTRDIYLYLPYRMLNIFPTVAVFGNLDLTTGKAERKIVFYPTTAISNQDGILKFRNGITYDVKKGKVILGKIQKNIKYFITTQNTKEGAIKLQSKLYHMDGEYVIVYMQSYKRFVIMDTETFQSTYVQMFILGKYDKNLFELVVSSAYTKIYKLKI